MFINGCSLKTLDLNHNQIQGQIPRSLVKCQMLDDLNLGNNKSNSTFPFWLVSLPELKILVLLANGFYGPICDPHINFGLSKLHVIDLSHNNFSSKLPSEYFQNWSAILGVTGKDKSQPRFGIMPLKDLTMERKRVEEFEETLSMLGTCAASGDLQPRVTRESQPRVSVFLHTLEQSSLYLTHYPYIKPT
uniref:Uncharacterized protein n=1 Tax=Quercus lobata TaxID=97700 RepID=A0A7N2LB15_QUELO